MDNLKIEVPNVFYGAFVKALEECRKEKISFKVTIQPNVKNNSQNIEVSMKNPMDFYFLGRKFGQYKSEI